MKTLVFYLVIGVLAGALCAMLNLPIIVVWGALFAGFLLSIARIFYISIFSQDVKAIGKFIAKHKKDPVYCYLYNLGTGSKHEQREALHTILAKYPTEKYQAVYGAALAILNKDYDFAKKKIAPMLHKEEGQYTDLLIDLTAGYPLKKDVPTFKKTWMNKSLEAYEAFRRKDKETFEHLAEETLKLSKGIQYYSNYYAFQQLREEL